MKPLENKVAIITGASRGIGKAIAISFAKAGAKLALCATNEQLLQAVSGEIERLSGQKPLCFAFDIRDGVKITEAVKKTLDTYSRIDILVNNAGTTRDQLLAMMSEEDWDFVLSTNLKSVFLFTKAVSKVMIRQRSGRIINMSSVVGITGNAGQANYAASKGGVIAFTKTAAKELAKRNITVNAIAPGFIQTDMTAKLGEKVVEEVQRLIPLGRFGEAEDVANTALFLASDHSNYITGQVIGVDGGLGT
ncbi:MAG: 3-oxoacyl-[acyl-carrier-protein] reductase [Omnitrophica bacterium RIFCSPHIGHO2_02_FULL_46_11]|nr:MAG: 3-oxoacyl-[acyl-carrier-protein] reductase [Omnitrophica bacterium RIFCSPLOWO2_01_FULL_45_10b]OGW87433.1 MAG: 3-oxoacyl-[acyl-carrier-protein] reductase [Omnitrophica bacterium RIFCSPHIGHO2_02_FULL_46_11]